MKFLNRIRVSKIEAARIKANHYSWHQLLWKAFPGREDESRRFLFRVDDKEGLFEILLLSPYAPVHPGWGIWETKMIDPGFLGHRQYLFQLRANPTKRDKKSRKRYTLHDLEQIEEWMGRKAQNSGFELISCRASSPVWVPFSKGPQKGIHGSVDFDGVLQVTDREVFEGVFHKGIGTAKAFGYGMLALRPVG